MCEALWKDILVDSGTPWEPFGSSKNSSRRLGRPLGAPSDLFRALLGRLFDSLGTLLGPLRRFWGSLGALLGPQGSPRVLKESPRGPQGASQGVPRSRWNDSVAIKYKKENKQYVVEAPVFEQADSP